MNQMQKNILEATKRILESKGLSFATTKTIAKEARCSEGSIYNYFHDRAALLLDVFKESLPRFSEALGGLAFRVGEGTVEENLRGVFLIFLPFYRQVAPLMGSLFSDLGLLRDYQKILKASGKGPPISQNHLEAYLRAEQKLGRVRADADVSFYSELMLGSCFQRAFREKFMGSVSGNKADSQESDSIYAGKMAESMSRAFGSSIQS
jgi:AcrR family transcriptional regulator